MITEEHDREPTSFTFDVAIVAVGFESRCRWVTEKHTVRATTQIGLEFGFLAEGAYHENRAFFEALGFEILNGLNSETISSIVGRVLATTPANGGISLFIDISSMSREMIANVVLAVAEARASEDIFVTISYAPSKFSGPYKPAPIRLASPIKPSLAGWSAQPERPIGAIFGLGCDPGLALGALQVLEPSKAWVFAPKGVDPKFDVALVAANRHIEDIFDVTRFEYDITKPSVTRARFEALLNAVDSYFRIVVVPFGPKLFAWLSLSTVVLTQRSSVGVWAFSSKEQAELVDREAEGPIIWHNFLALKETLPPQVLPPEHANVNAT